MNAALMAAAMLAVEDPALRERLKQWRAAQTERVLANADPREATA